MQASEQLSIWPKLDASIFAGYAAADQQDYGLACSYYQAAIDQASAMAGALRRGQSAKPNKKKKPKAPQRTNTEASELYQPPAFYPVLPDRHLPLHTVKKELELGSELSALAIRQQQCEDLNAASNTFERAGALYANALGPHNEHSAWCFYCAGLLGDSTPQRREYLYRNAIETYKVLEASNASQIGKKSDCLAALAYCLIEQGRQEEAYEACEQAIASLEQSTRKNDELPALLLIVMAKLVNGGVLYQRIKAWCQIRNKKLPAIPGLPTRQKQILSLAITIAFFWFLLGSPFTAGVFLTLLLIHEMGHFIAARQVGVVVTPPVFTPMGAVITMLSQPKTAREEAYFAIAGPALGTAAAVVTFYLGQLTNISELVEAAKFAFVLNFFNLIPLAPMDGGRISMAITRKLWFVGALLYLAVAAAVIYFTFVPVPGSSMSHSQMLGTFPLKIFVLFWMAKGACMDFKDRSRLARMSPQYFQIGWPTRLGYTFAYLALAAILAYYIGFALDAPAAPIGH